MTDLDRKAFMLMFNFIMQALHMLLRASGIKLAEVSRFWDEVTEDRDGVLLDWSNPPKEKKDA